MGRRATFHYRLQFSFRYSTHSINQGLAICDECDECKVDVGGQMTEDDGSGRSWQGLELHLDALTIWIGMLGFRGGKNKVGRSAHCMLGEILVLQVQGY